MIVKSKQIQYMYLKMHFLKSGFDKFINTYLPSHTAAFQNEFNLSYVKDFQLLQETYIIENITNKNMNNLYNFFI